MNAKIVSIFQRIVRSGRIVIFTLPLVVTSVFGQEPVTTTQSPLISKCCQVPAKFLDETGTEVAYASTDQLITLTAEIPGDQANCEAIWSSKRSCESKFLDVTDVSEQDNGNQKNHYPNHWGPVVYKAQYTCAGDIVECTEQAALSVVDWGIWFFNDKGEIKKYRRDGANAFDVDFYDPKKKTIIFIHGARQGTAAEDIRQDFVLKIPQLDGEGNPVINSETGETVIVEDSLHTKWIAAGYNFAVFNWSQFADEENLEEIEGKLWSPELVDWRDPFGDLTTEALPDQAQSIAQLMIESYNRLNPPALGGKLQIIGHGIGAQLALELGAHIKRENRAGLLEKVVLLNGWWSDQDLTYDIGGVELTAEEQSRRSAEFLFAETNDAGEALTRIPMEGYRNIKFDLNEYQTEGADEAVSLPTFVGSDNDTLKAMMAFSNMETSWSKFLEVPETLNVLTFDNRRKDHEALYLWYLKSIDYSQRGQIVDSETPEVNGEALEGVLTSDWEQVIGTGFNANTEPSEINPWIQTRQFVSQIAGGATMESSDDSFVAENICVCELIDVQDSEELGVLEVHAAAIQEFAHKNELALFLRKPHEDTDNWVRTMYAPDPQAVPSPAYRMPSLREDEPCGDQFAGIGSVNPNIIRIRDLIGREIEDPDITLEGTLAVPSPISTPYRHFMFDEIEAKELYVYPMSIFQNEYWNYTFTRELIHKKLDRDWVINDDQPECYLVKDRYGNLVFESYKLHGIYTESSGQSFLPVQEESMIDDLNLDVNARVQDYNLFDFDETSSQYAAEDHQDLNMFQQPFTHDSWDHKNDWLHAGPLMGPQANLIVYTQNGRAYQLEAGAVDQQKAMYECLGIDWQSLYPDEVLESDPDRDLLYAETENPIPAESTNLGGYPVLYDASAGNFNGRPNDAQKGDEGRYNRTTLAKESRSEYIEWIEANHSDFAVTIKDYDISEIGSISIADTEPVGMHPHHYQRFRKICHGVWDYIDG